MRLFGWTCPECGAYQSTVRGARTLDGETQVKCPTCRTVERFATRGDPV